jgi:hypothetical protein
MMLLILLLTTCARLKLARYYLRISMWLAAIARRLFEGRN